MVKISFKTKELEKCATDKKYGVRKLGQLRYGIFMKRLAGLNACNTLEDAKKLPGKFHELVADRKGQWSCSLDNPYRLIFRPLEDPIPEDSDGKYIWIEIDDIEIIEIVDYHG